MQEKSKYFRCLEPIAKLIFKRSKTLTKVPLPDEPAVYLCNHSAANGPALMTLYFEKPHKTWMISYALDKKQGANFFFHDALFARGRKCQWFWRMLSHIIAGVVRPLLRTSDPILVYHDRRITDTFRESVEALERGESILIFPESPTRYTEYVHTFYNGFADVARLYYLKTGKCLRFYPVYISKELRTISVGEPIAYDPELPPREARVAIAEYAQAAVDALARELPPHKPVPFLPEAWYQRYGEYEKDVAAYWKLFEQNGNTK